MNEADLIQMPIDVFRLLRDFLNEYCGLYFDDNAKYKLEQRLRRRLKVNLLKNFREYYRFLRYSEKRDEELTEIMDVLTVNETYFFREKEQLNAFSHEILPEIGERNKERKKINIWSAGCSTGEEPYTLAMLILENGGFKDWDINIFASDISQRVLRVAREGVYKHNSFRATSMYYMNTYFQKQHNGDLKISDEVKKFVNFSNLNLLDPFKISLIGKMDVIFCRNVLIYFNRDARKKLVDSFQKSMQEGGYLLLGHSESLINISTAFTLRYLKNDIVYQKPLPVGETVKTS
jgi:chemotaxis protein methyltransferase CheR